MIKFNRYLIRSKQVGSILLLCIFSIFADIYYVDNSDTSVCSNSQGGGSFSQPWCTINYALQQINGGDTLRIKHGTYNQEFTLTIPESVSGTEQNPTLIEALENDSVIISGPGVDGGRVVITGVSWLILKKIKVTHYNQGIFIQQESHDIILDSCEVYGVGQEAIHVMGNSYNIIIQNSIVRDTRQWQYNGEGFYIGTGSAGPKDTTNNVIVRNCTIYNTTDEAIEFKPGTFGCIAENNHIYNITFEGVWGVIEVNQHTAGAQEAPREPGHIVRNNLIYDVTSSGIRAGTSCSVYNNVIFNAGVYGIYVNNQSSDTWTRIIYHNTVHKTDDSAIVSAGGTLEIKNNIGPSSTGNLPFNSAWFVNTSGTERDYHLVAGSEPVNSGIDLRSVVPRDKDNILRDENPDIGAYEYKPSNTVPASRNKKRSMMIPKYGTKITIGAYSSNNTTRIQKMFNLNGQCMISKDVKKLSILPNGVYVFKR